MQVKHILCGFESCYIAINNLPRDTKCSEIEELFKVLGVDAALFYVVEMRTLNRRVEAKVFVDADVGKTVADYLDGMVLRGEILGVAVDNDVSPNKMGSSANVLTVSWKLPSRTMVVHCHSLSDAEEIINDLNTTICCGQIAQANFLQKPGRSYFDGDDTISIEVSGVPASVLSFCADLFDGCYITDPDYLDSEAVNRDLRQTVEVMAGYQTSEAAPVNSNQIDVEVRIRLDSWNNAKRA